MNRERLQSLLDNEVAMMEAWEQAGQQLRFDYWEWKAECGTFRCLAGHYRHRVVEQSNMTSRQKIRFQDDMENFFSLSEHFNISQADAFFIFAGSSGPTLQERKARIIHLLSREAPAS